MIIKVDNLTKSYGTQVALENITFQVGKESVFGVLGSDGSGKTTLLHILAGYTSPTYGTVSIAGYDVSLNNLEVRNHIGYLPANASLYADLTVCKFLNFVAQLRKVSKRTKRVDEALDALSLADKAETRIGKLSEGARRLVGIAQAILHDPDVVILDEPTKGLAPIEIVEIHRFIKLLSQHYTIILSSEALPDIEQLCHQAIVLKQGHVVAKGPSTQLIAQEEAFLDLTL